MPESVHAVTCSIPTMADVVGYEEKRPETTRQIRSGYPRFVTHFYIRQLEEHWRATGGFGDRQIFFTASPQAAEDLLAFAGAAEGGIHRAGGLCGAHFPAGSPATDRARAFLQHSGCGISSRLAEQLLLEAGLLERRQPEELAGADGAAETIRAGVAGAFGSPVDKVHLATSGMNAFYALFRALGELQSKAGRTVWVQLGWLYVDTIEILRKMTGGPESRCFIHQVLDLDVLESFLEQQGGRVAGIVTEVPTNPLVQTADLPRLQALAARHRIPLIADPTLASPQNIDVLPYCDVAVNSLTKYAGSECDVMMGAAVFNPESEWAGKIENRFSRHLVSPFMGDLQRLAVQIPSYPSIMQTINRNTVALARFLEGHPGVAKVFWAYSGRSGENFARVHRQPDSPGGIITVEVRKPLREVYDRIDVPKGPSFGAAFTLICPFMYLAHYDLVSTDSGREELRRYDLDPELLRISVGLEDPDDIIGRFDEVL